MSSTRDQVFPPKPTFTETELPDQSGKVFLITGGAAGLGFELAKILYQKNGTVYIATRSLVKIERAIKTLRESYPESKGRLEYIIVDLADLATIRPAAQEFLNKETRLDVLFQNAGVMNTPKNAQTKQGHELQMGTNAIAPHLLARCLEDILVRTAHEEQGLGRRGTVRIVWLASMVTVGTPKGGVVIGTDGKPKLLGVSFDNYMQSKSGNIYLAHEWASRLGDKGVISVVVNPGVVKTELQRHNTFILHEMMQGVISKPTRYGAYTQLFAGLSPEVTLERNGAFIIPWGRFGILPNHIEQAMKPTSEKGAGISRQFWDYCETVTKGF
ncbi:NAD(P)-binding protein [Coniochaeta ligniaria NRRL 30616]|uniref:NAD(P)-binding protein n=1 Tax=Coniochaeta ligniaria NRRL 30616 TaxID=1408157 RepID=A0A1J7IYW0_9PEZI|nr:NAD(P)-binding protein [Coniochaeta ligniaria NRRL 30616]